jgi:hypothetical protein
MWNVEAGAAPDDTSAAPPERVEYIGPNAVRRVTHTDRETALAQMYRPPFEIMSRATWEEARSEGRDEKKWILVNVQNDSIFDCQVLNRDIWKNPGIMETIKENFIFMQYDLNDTRSSQYMQYYFQDKYNSDNYPHIAIVDPRTGEQVKKWSGLPAPHAPEFLMQLHEFLDRYSLDASAKNPVAKRKPEAKKTKDVGQMTEEEMMEKAIQDSLAAHGAGSSSTAKEKEPDPDDLTRSIGDISKPADASAAENGTTNGHGDPAPSLFASISSTAPHTEPPASTPNSTRIQIRHPSGRVVRRFLLTDRVRRIYEWLKAEPLVGKAGVEFELRSMQNGKDLVAELDRSVEEAGLKMGTVMVEFVD